MEQYTSVTLFDAPAIVVAMSRDEAERCEHEIVTTGSRLRVLLVEFYEREGWKALGYSSWRSWASVRLGAHEATAYRELTAGIVEREISPIGEMSIGTIPESHLRPLAPLRDDADTLREAWSHAHDIADAREERFTARHVEEAVNDVRNFRAAENAPVAPAMAVHFTSDTPEWYTPTNVLNLARSAMGGIDLDPASSQEAQATVQAAAWYGLDHPDATRRDGLADEWHGRVWLNPPYGDSIGTWVDRLVWSADRHVTEAIALLPARVDTGWWQSISSRPVVFWRGRLRFSNAEHSAPFPSAIVYFGDDTKWFFEVFAPFGSAYNPV